MRERGQRGPLCNNIVEAQIRQHTSVMQRLTVTTTGPVGIRAYHAPLNLCTTIPFHFLSVAFEPNVYFPYPRTSSTYHLSHPFHHLPLGSLHISPCTLFRLSLGFLHCSRS